ncbi:MAG: hypothetical protein FWF37_02535 [Chloroflexi bacterium]|nr:hypothetical protein [Chloroflexota bacterium]
MKINIFKRIGVTLIALFFLCTATAAMAIAATGTFPFPNGDVAVKNSSGNVVTSLKEGDIVTLTATWPAMSAMDTYFIYLYNVTSGAGVYIDVAPINTPSGGTGISELKNLNFGSSANAAKLNEVGGGLCRFIYVQISGVSSAPSWNTIKNSVISDVNTYVNTGTMPNDPPYLVKVVSEIEVISRLSFQGTTIGNVGSTVSLTGNGFGSNINIQSIVWRNTVSGATHDIDVTGMKTAADGSLSLSFVAPACAQGTYEATVTDANGTSGKTQNIYTINPKATLDTITVPAGGSLTVSGTGFSGTSITKVTIDGSELILLTPATITNGSFTATVSIASTISPGLHALAVINPVNSNAIAAGQFEVKVITLLITGSDMIYHNAVIRIVGTGYVPGATYYVKLSLYQGGLLILNGAYDLGTVTADADGVIDKSITIDGWSLTDEGTALFTGNSYYIALTSSSAGASPVGQPVAISVDNVGPVDTPNLESPKPGASDGNFPTFTWSAVTDNKSGVFYILRISNDASFNESAIKFESDRLVGTTFTMTTQLESGAYYWTVIAYDNMGNVSSAQPLAQIVKIGGVNINITEFPVWAWIVIGAVVLVVVGGIIYIIYRRSVIY